MNLRSLSSSLVLLVSGSGSTWSQGPVIVDASGGGAFTTLQAAVDAASAGDVLLVRSGDYSGFMLDGKALFVAADVGAEVVLRAPVRVRATPVGSETVLHGLDFRLTTSLPDVLLPTLRVEDCAGLVQLQELAIAYDETAANSCTPVLVEDSPQVVMVECSVDASGCSVDGAGPPSPLDPTRGAVNLLDSDVRVFGGSLVGPSGYDGDPFLNATAGGPALHLLGGFVQVSGAQLLGGAGGDGNPEGTMAFDAQDGGPAIRLEASSADPDPEAVVVDTTLDGGIGGQAVAPGQPGGTGPPQQLLAGSTTSITSTARSLRTDGSWAEGVPTVLRIEGAPSDLVWILAGLGVAPSTPYDPALLGSVFPAGPPLVVRFVGSLSAAGAKDLFLTPAPTGLSWLPLHLQAVTFSADDGFVVSNPRFVALLDA